MAINLIVFDMDGVLVDVTASYRLAIQRTVAHFTGREIKNSEIQDYKNQGGWNDDWALSTRIIHDTGLSVRYEDVVAFFQSIFHGDGTNGLIKNEQWIARDGLLQRLTARNTLAVFTGRMRWEAIVTLDRFAPGVVHEVVGVDDVLHAKPAPEGLLKLKDRVPHQKVWYIGDTVDDARAAARAAVPFIGIAGDSAPNRKKLAAVLKEEGAIAVLESINDLEELVS